MPKSLTYLFKRSFEYIPATTLTKIPLRVRGLYVLYVQCSDTQMNVVYVGMVRGESAGVRGRLQTHKRKKKDLWTHCSVYEVWDNITQEQVEELEGLFRHIYRKDIAANQLNAQKAYKPLVLLEEQTRKNAA